MIIFCKICHFGQQQLFCFFDQVEVFKAPVFYWSPVFIPFPWLIGIAPFSSLSRIPSATFLKADSTLGQSLALISMKLSPFSFATFSPCSKVMTRSLSRSFLLPTKSISMYGLPLAFTSSSQPFTCQKVSFLVMSYTSNAPMALRQYERVMDLKFSWPAVSQICNLIFLFRTLIVLAPNSTPIVTSWVVLVLFSINCNTTHDLPTPVSPMTMNLSRQWQEFIFI